MLRRLSALLFLLAAGSLQAQQPATSPPPGPAGSPAPSTMLGPAIPPADPKDVATVESTIAALYDVISGPAGAKRNWDRMRSLFAPGARLIPTGRRQDGSHGARVLTVEEYIGRSGPVLERDGFFEREIARRVERYGNVVHVFSTYDSKRKAEDPTPFARGINSIQLVFDGTRWWVHTVLWEAERPDNPIPARYLTSPP